MTKTQRRADLRLGIVIDIRIPDQLNIELYNVDMYATRLLQVIIAHKVTRIVSSCVYVYGSAHKDACVPWDLEPFVQQSSSLTGFRCLFFPSLSLSLSLFVLHLLLILTFFFLLFLYFGQWRRLVRRRERSRCPGMGRVEFIGQLGVAHRRRRFRGDADGSARCIRHYGLSQLPASELAEQNGNFLPLDGLQVNVSICTASVLLCVLFEWQRKYVVMEMKIEGKVMRQPTRCSGHSNPVSQPSAPFHCSTDSLPVVRGTFIISRRLI